jgi:molybdate transport system regulatory protein
MKIHLKLSILNDQGEPFMGRGPVQLLQGIERLGSINQAAKEMNLSYVKALKMIKRLETCLNGKILKTEIGGKNHGGSELTPLARKFIDFFTTYESEVANFAQERFAATQDRIAGLVNEIDLSAR